MIIVIDNFIKDDSLLNEISKDTTFFSNPGIYHWYPGWWSTPPTTLKQRLIEYIWGDNCPITKTYSISGFEYWTGIQNSNANSGFKNNLGNHYDKDESWFKKTGEIVTPTIGTVYYPVQDEFEGGMLEIFTEGTDNAPEVVYAKPNRLIIFEAGKYVHSVTPVTKGVRKAIAINLWETEPYGKQNGDLIIEG
jgi:hypothetical protein